MKYSCLLFLSATLGDLPVNFWKPNYSQVAFNIPELQFNRKTGEETSHSDSTDHNIAEKNVLKLGIIF